MVARFQFSVLVSIGVGVLLVSLLSCGTLHQRRQEQANARQDAIEAIRAYGGFVKFDDQGDILRVSLVYDEDESGKRVECHGTSDHVLVHLPVLSETKVLLIHGSQATDRAMQYVAQLHSLEKLYMWDAYVSDAGMANLTNLRDLRLIHASNSRITDRSLGYLSQLGQLEGMSLQGNSFTDNGLKHLKKMRQLKRLLLGSGDSRGITDAGMPYLAGLVNLELLGLQQTSIGDAGLHELENLKNLKELFAHGTDVSAEAAETLEKVIPGLKVDLPRPPKQPWE